MYIKNNCIIIKVKVTGEILLFINKEFHSKEYKSNILRAGIENYRPHMPIKKLTKKIDSLPLLKKEGINNIELIKKKIIEINKSYLQLGILDLQKKFGNEINYKMMEKASFWKCFLGFDTEFTWLDKINNEISRQQI